MAPSYERFEAWRAGREMVRTIYRATAAWPGDERYGLTAQTRRAAVSVVLNIAEGATRRGPREFRRHTSIALASLAEVECALTLASDLGFASPPSTDAAAAVHRTGRLLWSLHRSLLRPRP